VGVTIVVMLRMMVFMVVVMMASALRYKGIEPAPIVGVKLLAVRRSVLSNLEGAASAISLEINKGIKCVIHMSSLSGINRGRWRARV